MEIRRLRTLAVEIFKTLNEINPPYMKKYIHAYRKLKVKQNDIIVKRINTSRLVPKLKVLRSKYMEQHTKSETSFPKFKEYIKTWLGPKCKCKVCINM